MSVELPQPLRAALQRELEGVSRRGLAERAARTSEAYRSGKGSAGVIRGLEDALAYALARLPGTYAACATVLAEAARLAPGFAPRTVLDAGSGPAAASWAAQATWPGVAAVTWLDASAPFLDLAGRLAADAPRAIAGAARLKADLVGGGPWPKADLVAASYALAEIPPTRQAGVVQALWASADGMLVLVEPGTPAGYARLLAAREALVADGADVLAPCPHARTCPLAAPDWCHFSVRLPRTRDHKLAKGADAPFEDEKFAYLVAARPAVSAGAARGARVLRHPRTGKPGIELRLCGPEGLETRVIGKRDKAAFPRARRAGWGDAWEG